ncbi:Molybdopterin-guanine dinucleotide biosynthesis protein MobA [Burkholderia singularis]|uniref:Molybdenum cofactor guanylyltransferase n=1 Tax=Burkholderia singularis TaxID=1503053 RepID=A0A238HDF4_9BURK|nr:Molybdopterin-guanine dinucleotide biosynthesis protein MobA [Burkholderia singularis]
MTTGPHPSTAVTGLLLAGGRGMRMGGLDKGLQPLRGEPLALHVLRRLAPQVDALVISANRHLDAYAALGAPFHARIVADMPIASELAAPSRGADGQPADARRAHPCAAQPDVGHTFAGYATTAAGHADADAADARAAGTARSPASNPRPMTRPAPANTHRADAGDARLHPMPGDADLPAAGSSGEFAGPLAGLLAGMRMAGTPRVLCVPCDSPLLPADLATRLAAALDAQRADIAFATTLDASGGIAPHPVFALINTALADDLYACLAAGQRRVRAWYARHKTIEVPFDDERAFYNANSLRDLAGLERA